jgi:transcriptional regulator with XRE-family HTH domain
MAIVADEELTYQPCRAEATGARSVAQTISRAILREREKSGISQTNLANMAGISRSTLNDIESGLHRDLRVRTFLRICEALNIRPDKLLGYAP